MDQRAAFNEAVETLNNVRSAAKAGDEEAKRILPLFDNASPAAVLVDLRRFRPKGKK